MKEIKNMLDVISRKEKAFENLYVVARNEKYYIERNDDVIKTQKGDIVFMYEIRLETTEKEKLTVKVTREMVDRWGVTTTDVKNRARENTYKKLKFQSLTDMLNAKLELIGINQEIPEDTGIKIYTLTTDDEFDGAGLLDSAEVLNLIREIVGSYYIIPSSIHEVLIVPRDEDINRYMSPDEIREMIREVNDNIVMEKERLSYNVYEYNAYDGLTIVY